MQGKPIFTFISLTYNHELYIVQHLESIKYQILNYGSLYSFQLIIADDHSSDKTIELVRFWCKLNKKLFMQIHIVQNDVNIGTCKNFTNTWDVVLGDYYKTLAGDDLFAKNNIFETVHTLNHNELVTGLPLLVSDNRILPSKKLIMHIIASSVIDKEKKFVDRIKGTFVSITPGLFTQVRFLEDKLVKDFVNKFTIIEDYPFLIKISELYPELSYVVVPKVYVLYRRTEGSSYIRKGSVFYSDRIALFDYLISISHRPIERFLQKNRKMCFSKSNKTIRLFNFNNYIYVMKFIIVYKRVKTLFKSVDYKKEMLENQNHLEFINANTKIILGEMKE